MRLGVGPGGVSPNEQTAPAIECSGMIQKTSPSDVNEEAPLRGRPLAGLPERDINAWVWENQVQEAYTPKAEEEGSLAE